MSQRKKPCPQKTLATAALQEARQTHASLFQSCSPFWVLTAWKPWKTELVREPVWEPSYFRTYVWTIAFRRWRHKRFHRLWMTWTTTISPVPCLCQPSSNLLFCILLWPRNTISSSVSQRAAVLIRQGWANILYVGPQWKLSLRRAILYVYSLRRATMKTCCRGPHIFHLLQFSVKIDVYL